MSDARCALCDKPIAAKQTVVFQADGQLAHVTCLASTRKPPGRLVPEPPPDPICAACSKPIGSVQNVIKRGADLLNVDCFLEERRQVARQG
jgi:hypothetical protein